MHLILKHAYWPIFGDIGLLENLEGSDRLIISHHQEV
jgi:hypothetical protein